MQHKLKFISGVAVAKTALALPLASHCRLDLISPAFCVVYGFLFCARTKTRILTKQECTLEELEAETEIAKNTFLASMAGYTGAMRRVADANGRKRAEKAAKIARKRAVAAAVAEANAEAEVKEKEAVAAAVAETKATEKNAREKAVAAAVVEVKAQEKIAREKAVAAAKEEAEEEKNI